MNEGTPVKAYIVKYAVSRGIIELDGIVTPIRQPSTLGLRCFKKSPGCWENYYYEGRDWTVDRVEAVKLANEFVAKAIVSTEKKLARLKKIKFV